MNELSELKKDNQAFNQLLIEMNDQLNAVGRERDRWKEIARQLAEKCGLSDVEETCPLPEIPECINPTFCEEKGNCLRND